MIPLQLSHGRNPGCHRYNVRKIKYHVLAQNTIKEHFLLGNRMGYKKSANVLSFDRSCRLQQGDRHRF